MREASSSPTFQTNPRWVVTACQVTAQFPDPTNHLLSLFLVCFQLLGKLLDLAPQELVLSFGVPGRRGNLSSLCQARVPERLVVKEAHSRQTLKAHTITGQCRLNPNRSGQGVYMLGGRFTFPAHLFKGMAGVKSYKE